MSATVDDCRRVQSKATLITLVDVDFGCMALLQVAQKGDDNCATRFAASFLDRMRADGKRFRHDGESCLVHLVQEVRTFKDAGANGACRTRAGWSCRESPSHFAGQCAEEAGRTVAERCLG